ncbi:MAG: hypothetical protein ACT4OZ_15145, partial [Gemmatimonadota bacterium]
MRLILALLASTAVRAQGQDSARSVVRAAQSAVEQGTLNALESGWRRRLARAPADPYARLGLAVAEQLTYRFEAAESRIAGLRTAPPAVARQAALLAGTVAFARGQYENGRQILAALSRDAATDGDSLTRLEADIARTGVTTRLLGATAAIALLDTIAAHRPARDPVIESAYECTRSSVLGLQGRLREARAAAHAGVAIARRSGALRAQGTCGFRLLTMFVRSGETDSVRAWYEILSPLQRRTRDFHGLAATLQWAGSYAINLGQYPFALHVLDSAMQVARIARNVEMLAW